MTAANHFRAPLTRPQEARLDELCEEHGTLQIDSFWSTAGRHARLIGDDGWVGVLTEEGEIR